MEPCRQPDVTDTESTATTAGTAMAMATVMANQVMAMGTDTERATEAISLTKKMTMMKRNNKTPK